MSDLAMYACPDCPGREPFKNERGLQVHRSKGRCRRHYLTPRSSRAAQSAPVTSPSRDASPSPASSPTVPHAAASQPDCVQPRLADQPAQQAAPQASGQLQPVGVQLCPVTATFQLHPSLVHVSSSTQAAAVAGPHSSCLGRRAGCYGPWQRAGLLRTKHCPGSRAKSRAHIGMAAHAHKITFDYFCESV